MRTATIILSVLLAIAIGSEIITYSQYATKKDALLEREEMLSEANKNADQLNKQMSDLSNQIKELTAQVDAEKKEKADLKAKTAAAGVLREKLVKANEDVDKLKQMILNLEDRMKALSEQVAAEKLEKAALKVKAAVADDLKEKLVEANEDADKLKQMISDLEDRMKALTEQVTAEKMEKAALKAKAAEADDLQEKLVEANEDADRLKQRISDLEDRMKALAAQVAVEEKEKSAFKAKAAAAAVFQEKLDKLGKDLEEARKTNKDLGSELESRDAVLAVMKERIVQMEGDLEETNRVYLATEGELALKEKTIMDFEERFENIKSHIPYLKLELEKEKDQIKGMHGRLENLMDEKEKTVTEMQQMKSTYDSLISDLKNQIDTQEVTIKTFEKKISVSFVDRILFDFGMANISPQGREILTKVGETLKGVNNRRIRVIGHTDNVGIQEKYQFKFPSNWELSAARAASVVRYFQEEVGVEPGILEAVGRSFYEPIADNDTSKGRAQNRRVNIVIAPNL